MGAPIQLLWAAVAVGSTVFAGTVVASGALDIQTEKLGRDTTFARIVALVEDAEAHQAPVQKLADKVAAWLGPVVLMCENHRSDFLWRLMRACPYVGAGLRRAGFRNGWL